MQPRACRPRAWRLSRRAAISSQLSSACSFFILLSWLPTFFKETFPSSKVGGPPWHSRGEGGPASQCLACTGAVGSTWIVCEFRLMALRGPHPSSRLAPLAWHVLAKDRAASYRRRDIRSLDGPRAAAPIAQGPVCGWSFLSMGQVGVMTWAGVSPAHQLGSCHPRCLATLPVW